MRATIKDYPLSSSSNEIQFPELPQITTSSADATSWKGDLMLMGVFEEDLELSDDAVATITNPGLQEWDKATQGLLSEIVIDKEFKGKTGSKASVRWTSGSAKHIGIVGLGPRSKATLVTEWGTSTYQAAGAALAAEAKSLKAASAAFYVGGNTASLPPGSQDGLAAKFASGVLLGAYEALRYKEDAKPSKLSNVEVLGVGSDSGLSEAIALAKGTLLTRYVLEMPANDATPTMLANTAEAIAAGSGGSMTAKILEQEDCEKMGMGLYLGVSACSAQPPKFIHLTYSPKGGSASRKVAMVGKGLTFDSGGYNLKVGGMIEMMKFDKGGACAVLGAAYAISQIQPSDAEVHFIIASCENMIDGHAMRPDDILTAMNGKTVEVNNTDAEGRLTLADALLYAQQQDITEVVDIATLTGACMVGLGTHVAGLFTPSEKAAASVKSASQTAGEKVWRMPMEESYWEQMKSPIADMKNTGARFGGAITASLFLKQYIDPKKVEWAHLDIAGPAWDDKAGGATGFGAQTLAVWAMGKHAQAGTNLPPGEHTSTE